MLRKMLKYDLKAMAKTFIPFYAVILLMSVLNIIFIRAEWTPGMVSGTLIYVCLFMALAAHVPASRIWSSRLSSTCLEEKLLTLLRSLIALSTSFDI